MAHVFSDDNFEKDVLGNDKVTMIDLWAEWCGPCRMMSPVVEELSKEYEGRAVVGKINVDDNPNITINYNVRGIPTFLFFKNGQMVDKVVGAQTKKALQDKLEALI